MAVSDALQQKIQAYLKQEKNEFFRKDVENALAKGDEEELNDRFYRDLEFGTAGLRGIIAGGLNRMNNFVIQRTSQGLAQYLLKQYKEPKAVISYDCRHFSLEFAHLTAQVLASNGVKVYLFNELHPTPALAFATVHLQAQAGIMITASHNPPEYNGYKVFQYDGSQIISPADKDILKEIEQAKEITLQELDTLKSAKKIEMIGTEIDELYYAMAKSLIRNKKIFEQAANLKVVYTPLHGTGAPYIEHLFKELNVNYVMVAEQAKPDGNFPTVSYPNPEETKGLAMALDLAAKEKAALVIANDPDSDRMAVAYADKNGQLHTLNGNQMGCLFADYLLQMHHNPNKAFIVKSIVTGELEKAIAEGYKAVCHNVLTGFKWIADAIRQEEKQGNDNFVFGNEEAIGYLVGKGIRDKDGITAAVLTVEMALHYQSMGKTLGDRMEEIYLQHGYYEETQISKNYPGEQGAITIKKLMTALREQGLTAIGERKVKETFDFLTLTIKDDSGKQVRPLNYATSDVLQFYLDDGSRLSVRPSGTEPKIKFYLSSCVKGYKTSGDKAKAASFETDVNKLITQLTQ